MNTSQQQASQESSDFLPASQDISDSQEAAILELYSESAEPELDEVNAELSELFGLRDVVDTGDNILDDLLAESMQAKAESDLAKKARQALHQKDSKLNRSEREELQNAIRSYEAKREWYARADVALFHIHRCQHCNHDHKVFSGFFQRQVSRFTSVDRWVRAVPDLSKNLPKETRVDVTYTSMCSECCHDFGYPEAST